MGENNLATFDCSKLKKYTGNCRKPQVKVSSHTKKQMLVRSNRVASWWIIVLSMWILFAAVFSQSIIEIYTVLMLWKTSHSYRRCWISSCQHLANSTIISSCPLLDSGLNSLLKTTLHSSDVPPCSFGLTSRTCSSRMNRDNEREIVDWQWNILANWPSWLTTNGGLSVSLI